VSQSPNNEQAESTDEWLHARNELSEMIKRGRSFSGNERNCCFLNTGHQRFATISAVSGLDFPDDGRAVASVDWDQDGDLDLWISNRNAPRIRLMRNDTNTGNHTLALRLAGDGTATNRDAIGARVEVVMKPDGSDQMIQTLRAGEGFLSQSSKWLHFGLGDQSKIKKVVVHWPGGSREEFTEMQVDRRYLLRQSSNRPENLPPRDDQLALKPSISRPPQPSRKARVPLATLLPMPSLAYLTSDGSHQKVNFDSGKPLLVNLWASWCAPCVKELREFSTHESTLRSAGIEVLALSVDGLGDDKTSPQAATSLLQKMNFPFSHGHANRELLDIAQRLHDDLVVLWKPLPIPTSLLIDAKGRLAVIYKGPVSIEQLLHDVNHESGGYVERLQYSACIPGQAIDNRRVKEIALQAETRTRYRVAAQQKASGRIEDAFAGYLAMVNRDPRSAIANGQLGSLVLTQGKLKQAADYCRQSLSLDPKSAQVHNTLGLALFGLKMLKQAQHHYEKAIEIQPHHAVAHNNLGSLFASQGEFSLADKHFRTALEIDPKSAEAHTNLGSIHMVRKELDQAAEHYKMAIRIDPQYVEAHNNLGGAYFHQGNLKQAITCYRRALAINPNYQQARDNLKRVIIKSRKAPPVQQ
jgi:tetratricopeptide (TPR) repeat protein